MLEKRSEIQLKPNARDDLHGFYTMLKKKQPFTFVRFSDGEIEILRNRKLLIDGGITEFRKKVFKNQFPECDKKRFIPHECIDFRQDLLAAAMFQDNYYFKGIPSRHNKAIIDREFMLRLNGGFTPQMTFSDLFINSNYILSRKTVLPTAVSEFSNVFVVANFRSCLQGYLSNAELVSIPDNIFSSYSETYTKTIKVLLKTPNNSLILSSASSLSNILGHQLKIKRPDLTFLDIGTALNDLLGLPLYIRNYHKLLNPQTLSERISAMCYKLRREYRISW